MRRGLHILGADAPTPAPSPSKAAEYAPYAAAAGQVISSIVQAARTDPQAQANFALEQQRLQLEAAKSSNTVWYVAGGAAVLAVLGFLLLRR